MDLKESQGPEIFKKLPSNIQLISLRSLMPELAYDIRYAGTRHPLSKPVYPFEAAWMVKEAAMALAQVENDLNREGLGILVYDAYRPWSVTKLFWESLNEHDREFFANPKRGSVHNRGCAIDCGLIRIKDQLVLEMPTEFDELTEKAATHYEPVSDLARAHREKLQSVMKKYGFEGIRQEWWHFNFKDKEKYPLLDIPFEELI